MSRRTPPAIEAKALAMLKRGTSQRDVAAKLGISKGVVSAIVARDAPQLRQRTSAPKVSRSRAAPTPSLVQLFSDGEALAVALDTGDAYAVLFDIEEDPQNLAALVIFVTDNAADFEPEEGETPAAFELAMVDVRRAGQGRAVALLEAALAIVRKAAP
jgi:hypothetical protein